MKEGDKLYCKRKVNNETSFVVGKCYTVKKIIGDGIGVNYVGEYYFWFYRYFDVIKELLIYGYFYTEQEMRKLKLQNLYNESK